MMPLKQKSILSQTFHGMTQLTVHT